MSRNMKLSACAALAIGIAACGDSGPTSGDGAFDVIAAQVELGTFDGVLSTDVWESFRVLGARFVVAAPPSAALRDATSTSSVPRIPFGIRGTTFVLDPGTLLYVPDPERPGAPANGVRFVLYAVDPVSRQPLVDREIGHADLTDEGDDLPSGVALRLQAVSGEVSFLDYKVTADGAEGAGALEVEGFTSDGTNRLTFVIGIRAVREGSDERVDVGFQLAMPERGFGAAASVRNVSSADGTTGEIEMTVQVGDDVIAFAARGTPSTIDATFVVNGRPFAQVSGDPGNPDIRRPDGSELTPEAHRVLQDITRLTRTVFEMFNHLMQPAGSILNLSMLP